MKVTRSQIRNMVARTLQEARYGGRAKDAARKWKQGDPLNLTYDDDDDDDFFPEEIRQQMSDIEKEKYLDDEEEYVHVGAPEYTLDDIVDTQVLNTRSAPGTLNFITSTLTMLEVLIKDDSLMEDLMDIKESQLTFDDFAAARDSALKVWIPTASEILGQDASKLPEFSESEFMNGFLFDFWFMATYIRPVFRQLKKDKTNQEAITSSADRWKYMTAPNRAQDFIKNILTPAFTYLTRDTSVAG